MISEKEMNDYFNDKYGCSYKRLEELFEFEMDRQMKLSDKLEQLQNNWNELKEYCLNEQIPEEYDEYNSYIEFSNNVYENVLNKMQELENKQCHTTLE